MARSTLISFVSLSLTLTLTLAATGCKDKAAGSSGSTSSSGKPAGPTALPKVGLSIDLPGAKDEIMVSDGMGERSQMVNTVPTGGILIDLEDAQPTLETVKSDAQMFTPKNLKDETLPDGFAVTFDNTGSMGANYFVEVHRKIDGKNVKCSGTSDTASKQKAALAACKTIHK